MSLSNKSKLDTLNELSYNPLNDVKQSYEIDDMNLKNLGLSILDKNNESIENDKTVSYANNIHQVCTIQITELKNYWKQLEQDCHSLNQRLQDQNAINQELEHKNVLIESKYQGKVNEVEIVKKWLKDNTEISKELKSILASTTSALDLTKVNNQNLAKKVKKYKKLVKTKNNEIESMCKHGINESVAIDMNNMFGVYDNCNKGWYNPFQTDNSFIMSKNRQLSMNRGPPSYLMTPHNHKRMNSHTRIDKGSHKKAHNYNDCQIIETENELQKYETVYLTDRDNRKPIYEEIRSEKYGSNSKSSEISSHLQITSILNANCSRSHKSLIIIS